MSLKHPFFPIIALVAALFYGSCGNDASTQQATDQAAAQKEAAASGEAPAEGDAAQASDAQPGEEVTAESAGLTIEMQNAGIQKLVKGIWQNKTVPGKAIEFTDTKFRRYLNNKMVGEFDYVIDVQCGQSNCQIKGQKPFGWCFTVQEGNTSTCHVVTSVNAVDMVITLPDEGGAKQNFVRETSTK